MNASNANRLLVQLATVCGLILLLAPRSPVWARGTFLSTWQAIYPDSASDDNVINGTGKSCQLCHETASGGGSWNGYGWDMKLGLDAGLTVAEAIAAIEGFDSDIDPTASDNLTEINADAQPGWTDGANNTIYFKDGTTATGQLPPADILGNLDPAAANQAPVAADDAYTTQQDTVLDVPAPGVLANDVDPDGDPISAVLVTDVPHGLLALAGDGSFTYLPDPGFVGVDSFAYVANDGALDSNIALVQLTVTAAQPEPVDLDFAGFRVSRRVRLAGKRAPVIDIKLVVKNDGAVDEPREAIVIGTQNGAVVFEQTLLVSDPVGDGRSTFHLSYTPVALGDVIWEAVILDDDPDDDFASATTVVQ